MTPNLEVGDATPATTFTLIERSGANQRTTKFKAPKGREFVVLLIGEIEKGAQGADITAMLRKLGYVPMTAFEKLIEPEDQNNG